MQKSHNRKGKKHNNESKPKKFGHYLPIIFIITLLPLVFYGKIVELPLTEANFGRAVPFILIFFIIIKQLY